MNATVGEPAAAGSLHQRILDDISGRILSGEWQPGYRIPFEHELTARYGCSRMTVNKAMSQLAKAGLIERRRRSGSFVTRPRSQAAVLEIHDIKTEVEALGLAYGYQLAARAQRRAVRADQARLAVRAGTPLLDIVCRHAAGGRPFCLEQRLINLSTVPEAADEPFSDIAPGPWLLGRVPWSAAEHVISAFAADAAVAEALGLPAGAPCLVIERRTWSEDRPLTHVRLIYPGDSHRLVARFTPSGS